MNLTPGLERIVKLADKAFWALTITGSTKSTAERADDRHKAKTWYPAIWRTKRQDRYPLVNVDGSFFDVTHTARVVGDPAAVPPVAEVPEKFTVAELSFDRLRPWLHKVRSDTTLPDMT